MDAHGCGNVAAPYDRGVKQGSRQTWGEHGFLVLLALLCAVLTGLQFRWTGELARAEFERLGGDQREAGEAFTREFDHELSASVATLTPTGRHLGQDAITSRVKAWHEGNPRPIFSKLALAIPKKGALELNVIDPANGKMTVVAEWPQEWEELRDNLEEKADGFGGGPFRGEGGMIFEMPVYDRSSRGGPPGVGGPGGPGGGPGGPGGGPEGRPPGETAWMIFEIDAEYLKGTWLPELVKRHINPGARDFHQVKVSAGYETIFSSGPGDKLEQAVKTSFNSRGRRESGRGGPAEPKWQLSTRRQTGALEEMVTSSRRRNLALACGVNILILAAGYALIRQTRKSRLLAEARMNFVANVSHELRTPVTVILGAAHNMKRGIIKKPEAQERYTDLILQHGQQLSDMVQEVLEFSSVRPGMALQTKAPVAVNDLLRKTMEDLRTDLAGMRLETSFTNDLPMVAGDAAALGRVFRNLLSNAAKHGAEGKWIGVSTARVSPTRVEIVVADHGPGVPQAEHARIFEPFYRGEQARYKQTRGTGLGLGLVSEIVAAHGGKVFICSKAGEGASFTVSLPITAGRNHGGEYTVGRG